MPGPRLSLPLLLLPLILTVTWLVYRAGLAGSFVFDDLPNIVDNRKLQIDALTFANLKQAVLSINAGPLMRPVTMLSLALNYLGTGLDPYYFKLTNLVIHLVNGLAVYLASHALFSVYRHLHQPQMPDIRLQWLALAVAAVWLLHPMNLTGVLYVVQRAVSLSALFVLLGITCYLRGRMRMLRRQARGIWLILASVGACLPLAALSKENGLLLPFLLFVIEWSLLGFRAPSALARRQLLVFHLLVAVLPAIAIAFYLLANIDWLQAMYVARDFNLPERLLTEARVIWFYLAMSLVPMISRMGLYHDDIVISTSLTEPFSTLPAIIGLAGLLGTAVVMRRRAPLASLGILFFLGAHSLESSVFSLEIAHEHRNYLPVFGILVPSVFYLSIIPWRSRHKSALNAGLLSIMIALLAISTAIRAHQWSDARRHALVEAANHPGSARALYRVGWIYALVLRRQAEPDDTLYRAASDYFERSYEASENNPTGLFAVLHLDEMMSKPVDMERVRRLETHLRDRPFAPSTAAAMRELNLCQVTRKCALPRDVVNRLFQATFDNPTLEGSQRASLLNEAMIQAQFQGNLAQAIAYSYQAIALRPKDIQLRLNIVSVLIKANRLDEAQQIMDALGEENIPEFYRRRYLGQQEKLRRAEAISTSTDTDN